MILRAEQPMDAAAVRAVHDAAFQQPHEGRLVDALRGTTAVVSLVAEQQGEVVGHILFSRIVIEPATPVIALAPMAVRPGVQLRGIGSALVRAGLDECRRLGHRIVIVLGHPDYYPRFGFRPARPLGILPPFPSSDEAWLALALVPGAFDGVCGIVRYPAAFDGA